MYFESTTVARLVLEQARQHGVPPGKVLRDAGLDERAIRPDALHLPWPALEALLRAAVRLTGDTAFGLHLGTTMDFRHIDIAGPYALNQPTIRDGIRITWGEVQPLQTSVIRSELREHEASASLRLHCPLPPSNELNQLIEFYLMSHITCSRLVSDSQWMPQAVRFRHAPPPSLAEHRRHLGCTPLYRQPVDEVEFDRAFLDRRFPLADPRLLEFIRPRYEAYLDALRRSHAVTLWLRRTLSEALGEPGAVDLRKISERMRLRPRTLQHKLAAEETTFHRVLDAVRHDVAVQDLSASNCTMDAVAARLKFSDARSFLRAFRRWTGLTPGQWKVAHSLQAPR